MNEREAQIRNYIDAYNHFDTEKMMADLDDDIVFENYSGDQLTLSLTGRDAFRAQADAARAYFTERTQAIRSISHHDSDTEVTIDYSATLAQDLPNGLRRGDRLQLQGRSLFEFRDGRIIRLTDIS